MGVTPAAEASLTLTPTLAPTLAPTPTLTLALTLALALSLALALALNLAVAVAVTITCVGIRLPRPSKEATALISAGPSAAREGPLCSTDGLRSITC